MLKILIVEDEPLLAGTLKSLIELNPRYRVTAIAEDAAAALAAAQAERPDLAIVDLQLANGTTGFAAAAKLRDMDVLCLFTTGGGLAMPVPDLAIGCLAKPYDEAALVQALREAEDALCGRSRLVRVRRLPEQLQLYAGRADAPSMPPPVGGWLRARTGIWARLWRRLRSPRAYRSAAG